MVRHMVKAFLTNQEVCNFFDGTDDNEERKLVILPLESRGDVTDKENDYENLIELPSSWKEAEKSKYFVSFKKSNKVNLRKVAPPDQKQMKSKKIHWKKTLNSLEETNP